MAAPSAGAATTCAGVAGTPVLVTAKLKVVSQKVAGGRRFVGCARPSGKVRVLGTRTTDADGATTSFSVVKSAGTYVLFKREFDEGPALQSGSSRHVIDLATGRQRTLWSITLAEGDCPEASGDPNPIGAPKQFALGSSGIVVGVFVPGTCAQPGTRVVAFVPGRAARALDRGATGTIAATSLKLAGRTASWRHGGKLRTAKL